MNATGFGQRLYVPSIELMTGMGRNCRESRRPMFTSIVRFIQSWKRYNRSLNELNRLGDRELADIGISRSDIARVAWQNSQAAA